MSDEKDDELTRWRKERGIPEEEVQRLFSPELRMLDLLERLSRRVEANEPRVERNGEEARGREEQAKLREERIQRTIEFIAQQQAQFSSGMHQLRELQKQDEERWVHTGEDIRARLAIAEMHEREFFEMRQAQAQAQARTDAQIAEARARADARSAEIDERLNALINTVERIIGGRRNGGGKREESSG